MTRRGGQRSERGAHPGVFSNPPLSADRRAVSMQIGAVLLLAIVVSALSLYQVNAIPEQNRGAEVDHHEQVRDELLDVRNGLVNAPRRGTAGSYRVTLGPNYPSRSFFVNPPPADGRLRTDRTDNTSYQFEIENATPVDPSANSSWNGSFETGALVYEPRYNEHRDASTVVYENSVLYNSDGSNRAALTGQTLLDGDRLTIVVLDGRYSTQSGSATIDFETVSASENTIDVNSTDDVVLRVPTRLQPDEWHNLLEDEDNFKDVRSVSDDDDYGEFHVVEIVLKPGTYELQMAKIGLGSDVGEDEADKSYLTVVDGPDDVTAGETTEMTVEVRDRFNNPVSDVRVNASAIDEDGTNVSDRLSSTDETTGSDGQVTFKYDTDEDDGGEKLHLNASFVPGNPNAGDFDGSAPENVSETIKIRSESGGGGSGGGGGGGGAYSIYFDEGSSYEWNVSEEGYALTLTANTDPPLEGVSTDFAVNDSSVAAIDDEDTETDSSGQADVALDAKDEGTVAVYVGSSGSSDVINVTVTGVTGSNTPPGADFTYSPSDPSTLDTIDFDASASSDSDGSIESYEWDFDDGSTATNKTVDHSFDSPGSYDVTLTVTDDEGATDTETKTVTVGRPPVISAVEPDPEDMSDEDGEFVRVYFPTATSTNGWVIDDDDGQTTTLPDETLEGEIYFARNPSAFADNWGIDESQVYELDTLLGNSGDPIELRTGDGTIVDEFAYGDATTSNGWSVSVGEGEVAVRDKDGSGDYVDTNSSSDWTIEDESAFFGSDTDSPIVTDASITNAPINYGDAGDEQTVTVTFNESMDTDVDPTVEITEMPETDDKTVSGGWTNDTAWEGTVTLERNDDDTDATISVGGAQDADGNAQSPDPDTSNAFTLDTDRPNDPDDVRIVTDPINASSEDSVTVAVDVDEPDADGGTVSVRLEDPDGTAVTVTEPMATGSGTVTTTVSGIDVSALSDADPNDDDGIVATAKVLDDVDNENPSGYTTESDGVLKDTVAPSIEDFTLTNPSGSDLEVEIVADESLSEISVDIEDGDGTIVTTLDSGNFTESESGSTYTYTTTYTASEADDYTATLESAADAAGNDGAAGESDTATIGQALQAVESEGVNGGSQLTFTIENNRQEELTVEQFAVNTESVGNNVRFENGDSSEVRIQRSTQEGEANRNGGGSNGRFEADGRLYDLVSDSDNGQYAILDPDDDDVTVDFRSFDGGDNLGTLEFADGEGDADIIVTLVLNDGTEQTFYFRQA